MNPVYVLIPIFIVLLGIILTTNQYSALEFLMLLFFLIIIFIIGSNYFFGVQLTAVLHDIFEKPKVDVVIKQPVEPANTNTPNASPYKKTYPPQTYHVQGKFNYNEAKAVCKAYNGQLATLDQLERAYKHGAEWCDYGWSENEMALYPTQHDTWKSYQGTPDEKRCGIPGVNGGYNMHVHQKLGANCFGKKPDGKVPPPPSPTPNMNSEAQEWLNKHLTIAPFNYKAWSAF